MSLHAHVQVGGVTVGIRTSDTGYLGMLHQRFQGFIDPSAEPDYVFDVELTAERVGDPEEDVRVYRQQDLWRLERGDFRAEWDPVSRHGRIRQAPNPYSIDTVLRLVHSLVLAREGGCLLHAASAVRGGKAFVFAGVSGAGKTTLARLAPGDAHVLSDEISYVRRVAEGYRGYGTPFAGELARPGENLSAPLEAIYLLAQGRENGIDPVPRAEAARALLGHVLFFAQDAALVQAVFLSVLELVERVPVRRLTFVPDARAWELIR